MGFKTDKVLKLQAGKKIIFEQPAVLLLGTEEGREEGRDRRRTDGRPVGEEGPRDGGTGEGREEGGRDKCGELGGDGARVLAGCDERACVRTAGRRRACAFGERGGGGTRV